MGFEHIIGSWKLICEWCSTTDYRDYAEVANYERTRLHGKRDVS